MIPDGVRPAHAGGRLRDDCASGLGRTGALLVRVLGARELGTLLPVVTLVEAVEQALHALGRGEVRAPHRHHFSWADNSLLLMPAVNAQLLGTKLVSVVPGNARQHQPVVGGLMLLFDAVTGTPASLMDAAMITALRTGALGAVAVKWMTPPGADSAGIIGTGVQGTWQAIAICSVRPIRTLYYLRRSPESEQRFLYALGQHVPAVATVACSSVEELLERTGIVIAATSSATPVLPAQAAPLQGKNLFSIGSFRPDMQELPDAAYRLAGEVVVDCDAALHEVGDLINPLGQGIVQRENVVHLSELIAGRHATPAGRTTVFKSVGMAAYDLYVAQALLAAAVRHGVGQQLQL
jgi:ornithine cyclodeaminase/alanine dehydrogenase-like protein (mu-crystallin family)